MGAFLILSALLILIDFFKLVVLHCEDITTRQQLCLSHLKKGTESSSIEDLTLENDVEVREHLWQFANH